MIYKMRQMEYYLSLFVYVINLELSKNHVHNIHFLHKEYSVTG